MMQLGEWRLDSLNAGRFWLDAGVMYGIVPKTVWQNVTPPDDANRIPFAIHSVLARNGRNTVLIDTGYGGKMAPLERKAHAAEPGNPIVESLTALGVGVDDIDTVVFTHLHWDHSGGATRYDEARQAMPVFPRATHYVNRLEWEDATGGAIELGESYSTENFAPFQASGQLSLVEGETEIVPGLWTRVTGGHTRGHQALLFESDGQVAIYPGDFCPAVTHLRRMWCTAYDLYPLEVRRLKPELMGAAADQDWWVLWDHDPAIAVSRLERHKSREFVVRDARPQL